MHKPLLTTTILASLLLLQGCASTSQTLNLTPYFDGQIKHNGTPLANIKVSLSIRPSDQGCTKASTTVSTGEQGDFSIRPISKQQAYIPFVNYSYTEWSLCAEYQQQTYLLNQNNRYDDARQSSSIYLDCDLGKPAKSRCKSTY